MFLPFSVYVCLCAHGFDNWFIRYADNLVRSHQLVHIQLGKNLAIVS